MSELNATPVSELSPEQMRSKRLCEAIAHAKANGIEDLWHLEAGEHDILFRRPTEQQYNRCAGKTSEDRRKAPEAVKEFALAIVVYPEQAEFRALISKYPAITQKIGSDAMAIAMADEAEYAKKV